jgi:ABC-2 type transport system ATP-binding protein
MIQLINVSKTIRSNVVLKNINYSFEEGQCVVITGHNGSGKTMLLRMICGLISPDTGEVKQSKDYKYGVIIETPSFLENETALYNLEFLASLNKCINKVQILNYLEMFSLHDVKDKKVKTFSLGMKQRLALCQALMENPDIILLDEPFNALDEKNLATVCNLIAKCKKDGKTIIIAAHGRVPESCNVDKVIKMSDGEIIEN